MEKSLDSQLWHACAGGMVQMPLVSSKVFYFPQGHAEHALANTDFSLSVRVPGLIPCVVGSIKFLADPETDEVYAKLGLIPVSENEISFQNDSHREIENGEIDNGEKPASFAKTLTQSDANNGGGFSVPRYCAETIFPRLDYNADPPVQTVIAKDVHGEVWKFRHIYRGTPRRHLLTTGWSSFVNQKKLIAGDSIVFLRGENGDLYVGIRRAKRGIPGPESPICGNWNPSSGNNCGFSIFLSDNDNNTSNNKVMMMNLRNNGFGRKMRPESVIEAASLAASGQPFEVVYYPRASTPEFCVKASNVKAAMRIQWCSGMRFKMPFETEDSSRISWFMGTVGSVQVADPARWPNSPWRLLQVTWDEPDLLQNVKRVSPWLVELVSNMPVIHLSPFSPPRKKLRGPQNTDFPFDGQYPWSPSSFTTGNPLGPCNNTIVAGIQGARHAQFGISLSDLHINNNNHHNRFQKFGFDPYSRLSNHHVQNNNENISCLLTMGISNQNSEKKKSDESIKKPQFLLFGQPILTEQQIFRSCSSEDNFEKRKVWSNGSGSSSLDMKISHWCMVYIDSEDVGRTLDLSVLESYEELYKNIPRVFGLEKLERVSHVIYRDATGALKHAGDEPFSHFKKTAKRVTVLTGTGSGNVGRKWTTGLGNAENGMDSSTTTGPLSIFV